MKNADAIQIMILTKYKEQFDMVDLIPNMPDEVRTALKLMVLSLCVNVYLEGVFDGTSQSIDC